MIDVNKCKYEESFREEEYGFTVHYFVHPKSLKEVNFCDEKDYKEFSDGKIVRMCVSLTAYDNGEYYMQMSPTVEDNEGLHDVDWRDLELGVNYTEDDISKLLNKVKRCFDCNYWLVENIEFNHPKMGFCLIHHESKSFDNRCPSYVRKKRCSP